MRAIVRVLDTNPARLSYLSDVFGGRLDLVVPNRARTAAYVAESDVVVGAVLVTGARALAFLHGRDYVLPEDVGELALDVLRHRIVLSYEALADEISADTIITKVLDAVAVPEVVLSGR